MDTPNPTPRSQLASFGTLWNQTLTEYRSRFGVYFPIAVISVIGSIASAILTAVSPAGLALSFTVLFGLVSIILNVLAGVALVYAVINRNETPTYAQAFTRSRPFLWKWITTNILTGLMILLGFILFIIPGIIWAVMYAFSSYLVVRENLADSAAMKRSKALTKGRWFDVFWRNLVFFLIIIIISAIISAIFSAMTDKDAVITKIVSALLTALFAPLGVIFLHYLYETLVSVPPVTSTSPANPPPAPLV